MPRRILCLSLLAAMLAPAQILFEQSFTGLARPRQSLIADIVFIYTAHTPWGTVRQVETGKYWRSGKGLIRQDDSRGFSTIIDLRDARSIAFIDYELKLIDRTVDDSYMKLGGNYGSGISMADHLKKIENDTIEGHKVTYKRGGTTGMETEAWVSDKLKLPLRYIQRTPTEEIEQRFENIRLDEPDPALFELPLGFHIRTDYRRKLPSLPCEARYKVTEGITGQEPHDEEEFIWKPFEICNPGSLSIGN